MIEEVYGMDLNGKEDIRISIVLPVYNSENYIERAIRSVLQQKYSNYELIIVDDGSTDKMEAFPLPEILD